MANRDSPITNTSGVLAVDKPGQLVLFYSKTPQVTIWPSNISLSGDNNNSAKLLDTGNLVLFKNTFNNGKVLIILLITIFHRWSLGIRKGQEKNTFITSWKSPENPGTGQHSYRFDVNGLVLQLFVYDGLTPLMRMGPWNGITYSGVPEYVLGAIDKISKLYYINNEEEVSTYYSINDTTVITRFYWMTEVSQKA